MPHHYRGSCFISAAILLFIAIALAGCSGSGVDRDQARLCRLAAAALSDDMSPPTVLGQTPVSSADVAIPDALPAPAGEPAIRIAIVRSGAGGQVKPGFVACVFGIGADRYHLIAARTDQRRLTLPEVVTLDRFWLPTPDAAARDPMPIAGASEAIVLPRSTGYALQQIVNAVPVSAIYALLAVAYALVYGLIGRINLAFGAFAAVGGTAALMGVLATGRWGVLVALGAAACGALLPSAIHGVVTARLVFQPLYRASGQQGLVATIGLALVLGEYLRLAQGPEAHWIGPLLDTPMALARDAAFVVTITPITAIISVIAFGTSVGLTLGMRFSAFGRNWRAYRDDPLAASLFGIDRDRILQQTFALASAFAGLAGGITVVVFGDISFAYAQGLGLKALTAAVLGGIGSVSGAFFGGLLIGLLESAWSANFPIVHRDLVTFCILVATLIWRPGGFLGERDLVPRRV